MTSLVARQGCVLHQTIILSAAVAVRAFNLCFTHPWIFVHLCLLLVGSEVHCCVDRSTCFLLETVFVLSKHCCGGSLERKL